MQYLLCKRCKFKVPANRHSCQTCGSEMLSMKQSRVNNVEETPGKVSKGSFWRMLNLNDQNSNVADAVREGQAFGKT